MLPPFTGVAVKVTCCPEQIEVLIVLIVTDAAVAELTVTLNEQLVAGASVNA